MRVEAPASARFVAARESHRTHSGARELDGVAGSGVAEGHRAATPQAPLTRPGVGRMLLRRVGGSEVSCLVTVCSVLRGSRLVWLVSGGGARRRASAGARGSLP